MSWLSLITGLIKLADALTTYARQQSLLKAGEAEAIAAAHQAAAQSLAVAQAAEQAAATAAAADPTDGAFDQTFKRSD